MSRLLFELLFVLSSMGNCWLSLLWKVVVIDGYHHRSLQSSIATIVDCLCIAFLYHWIDVLADCCACCFVMNHCFCGNCHCSWSSLLSSLFLCCWSFPSCVVAAGAVIASVWLVVVKKIPMWQTTTKITVWKICDLRIRNFWYRGPDAYQNRVHKSHFGTND